MSGDPLLTAFADQLGLSSDEAVPVLERVIAALSATLESGDSVTLDGVGTFVRAGADLTFEPDALLVATVNGDYAGLSPVSEPVPVPFLTSFPVVPAVELEEPSITPVDLAEDAAVEPVAPAMDNEPDSDEAVPVAPLHAGEDLTIELGPNDDVEGPVHREDEADRDLASVMAGVWTPPPSPPVAPLETPDHDFDAEMPPVEAEDDQSTLSFEEAGFSFGTETSAPAQDPAVPPPIFASAVAAPFAATATAIPAPAPALVAVDAAAGDDGGWNKLWLVLPLVGIVAVGLWLMSQRESADDGAGAPIAAQPASGATGSGAPIGAGGAPVDSLDSALATEDLAVVDGDERSVPEPVAETTGPPQADAAPATPPTADGAGAYRPAPIRLAPVPQVAAADDETPASREPVRRQPTARPPPPPARPEPAPTPERDVAPAGAWGVRGTAPVDASAGGFTWILASTDAADARERVAIYRSLGFRAAVLTAFVGGQQVHRVAVGQFATASEARAARALLPNDAPADAWLLRLGRTP